MSGHEVHVAPRFYLCRALGALRAAEPVRFGFWRSPGDHQARRRSPLEQMTLYPVDRMGYAAGAPFAFVVAAVVPSLPGLKWACGIVQPQRAILWEKL